MDSWPAKCYVAKGFELIKTIVLKGVRYVESLYKDCRGV
jgi:hypothetical protein